MRCLRFAVALSLVATLGYPLRALAQQDQIDAMFQEFQVAKTPADFVVVVDTSGSMSDSGDKPYPQVLKAFDALVDAIPEGDNLSVVSFYGSPELAWQGKVTDSNRASAKASLPEVAKGENTDIGAALDETLRRLERADSSQVQTVIMLTDGQHFPEPGSKYPTESGAAWDALRKRADVVASTHDLQVEGFGLGQQGAGGIALMRTVFGNPEINNLPAEQLSDYFQEAVRRSQLARLRNSVETELDRRVVVQGKGDVRLSKPLDIEVPVTSKLEVLDADVAVSDVKVADADGKAVPARVVDGGSFTVAPGGTHTVTVRLQPDVEDERFKVPAVNEAAEYRVTIEGTYQVQPKETLARVTTKASQGNLSGSYDVMAKRSYGWTLKKVLGVTALAILVAAVLWWLYRTFIQVPKLVGFFVVENAASPDKQVLALKGKRQRITGKDVPGAGPAKIELFTKRRKRRHVFARVERPPFFEVDFGRKERAVSDETEIRLGRYRLGGGKIKYQPKRPEQN